jgi:acyl carrier protein
MNRRETIVVIVKKIISDQLGIEESHIRENDSIFEDYSIDSLDHAKVFLVLSVEFNIDFKDEFKTIKDIVDYIYAKKNEGTN